MCDAVGGEVGNHGSLRLVARDPRHHELEPGSVETEPEQRDGPDCGEGENTPLPVAMLPPLGRECVGRRCRCGHGRDGNPGSEVFFGGD